MLHDASHVVQTLRRLKLLLKAGGRLLIVEATERNSVFQLASVGFIEGLSGYRDFRRQDEKPMLTRSAWQEVLVQAGCKRAGVARAGIVAAAPASAGSAFAWRKSPG